MFSLAENTPNNQWEDENMRKIFKTSLAVAMTICMAATMTACGGSGSSANTAAEPAAEEASGEASGATVIKIGGSGPLTGGAAVYGQAVKNAADRYDYLVRYAKLYNNEEKK